MVRYRSPESRRDLLNQLRRILAGRGFWLAVFGIGSFFYVLWATSDYYTYWLSQADQLRSWIAGFGTLAPLAYIGIYILQIVVAPVPGNFMGVLAGYMFGAFWGALYGALALTIGISLVVGLSRTFGRPLIERFFAAEQIQAWEGKLRIRSPMTWCILFMFPVPDLLIYMAGLSSVRLRVLLPAIIGGRVISIILANLVGDWSTKLPAHMVVTFWIIMATLSFIVYQHRRRLRIHMLVGLRRFRQYRRRLRLQQQNNNRAGGVAH